MSSAVGSFRAEWLKLRRRPAVWVLGAVLVGLLVVLSYAVLFLLLLSLPANASLGPGVTRDALSEQLHPARWVLTTLGAFTGGGLAGSVALILGVLAYGSEYGWGTLKTVFTQRPGRLATLAGKAAALAVVLAVYTAVTFAATAACALVIGAADRALTPWPSADQVPRALLAAWLIQCTWASLGIVLSVLFRQSALAIGLGLIYAIVVEGFVLNLAAQFSFVRSISPGFPGANASALVRSFGTSVAVQAPVPAGQVGATQAALVLIAYVAACLVVTAALLRSRDVT